MKNVWKSKLFIGALLALSVIAAVVLVMVNTGRSDGNDLQEQLDLGKRYVAEMDYENAVIAYEAALEIDPYCLDAYLGLADAYMALGQPDKAIEVMEKAKGMLPQEPDVYTQLADLYFSDGNMESYIKVLEEGYENTGSGELLTLLEGYDTSQEDNGSHAENTENQENVDEEPEPLPKAETEDETAKKAILPVVKPLVPAGAGEVIPLAVPVPAEPDGEGGRRENPETGNSGAGGQESGDDDNGEENGSSSGDSGNGTDNGGSGETPDDSADKDEETITTGISGTVRDANNNMPLPDIKVTLKPAGDLESSEGKTVVTDEGGKYLLSLKPGKYVAIFSGADFVELHKEEIQVVNGEIFYYNPILLTAEQGKEKTSVKINIMDAVTAGAVGNAIVDFYEGFVNTEQLGNPVATGETDADGKALIEVPHAGYYTVSVQKDGYVALYQFLTVFGKEYKTQAAMSPLLHSENQYRIVMSWGAQPSILDSHFFGEDSDGSLYHVCWFRWRNLSQTVTLDIDHMGGYGPETITANIDTTKEQRYIVHNYSGGGNMVLSESGAKVQVYGQEGLVYEASVPNTPGTTWHVFNIKNGVIEPLNYIDFSTDKIYPGDGYGPEERAPYTYDNTNIYSMKMLQLDEHNREIIEIEESSEEEAETVLAEEIAEGTGVTEAVGAAEGEEPDENAGSKPAGSVSGNVATAVEAEDNP